MLLSMTGYGSGEAPLGRGRLLVDARAVNHRFLDVRVRLPPEIGDHAAAAEEVARRSLERGRIEITARVEGEAVASPELDVARARSAFEQLSRLRDELTPGEPVPLSLLATVPDLFTTRGGPPAKETLQALCSATEAACAALTEMRRREGAALAVDLRERLAQLRSQVASVRVRVPEAVESYRKKLGERLERLLRETRVDLDAGRLEHEVALFADKGDVTEELTRLVSHCDQVEQLLEDGSAPVGRKLDFLLQEMNRETNTIGSKSSDVTMARTVVDMKAELERMREQVQNVL